MEITLNFRWVEKNGLVLYTLDYRVKPEPHYVPYDSVLEVERDKWIRAKSDTSTLFRISKIRLKENEVVFTNCRWNLRELFEDFEYEDGSPYGKKVDE